jgi:transposase
MRGPYPGALRRRVIDFVEAGGSRREAAEQFDVSVSSAIRWLQHFRNDRRSEPMQSGGSVSPLEKHAQRIFTLIAEQPDLTLDEMVRVLRKLRIPASRRSPVSSPAITSPLKKSLIAAERKRDDLVRARRRWMREQGLLDPARPYLSTKLR